MMFLFAQNCLWHISNKYKVLNFSHLQMSIIQKQISDNVTVTSYISECKILEITLQFNNTCSLHNITNGRLDCTIQNNIIEVADITF